MPADVNQCIVIPFSWLTPTVVVISVISAAICAFFSIKSSREIARKSAAIDLMERAVGNDILKKASEIIREIHTNPNIDMYIFAYSICPKNCGLDEASFYEKGEAIRTMLNFIEHIAIGIKNDIYDETILKEQRYTAVTSLLDMTNKYIATRRSQSGHHTLYQDFERLAEKWKLNPLNSYKK
ncbi:MAG: DUF4760 domain-containing protein [Methylococcaceae bacterium]